MLSDIVSRTLLQGGAWKTLLAGLGVTLEISLLSILLGTILGGGLCYLRRRRNRWLAGAAAVYSALFRGSPVLLVLMLMYYVVFARTGLPAPLIAVAAFSLNFAAHACELMRSALDGCDAMQFEAARTLGFSRWQAFRLITLPQAFRLAEPTYLSAATSLVQWTSVVGYVTITDLTRAVNNIAARTMEPLFMIAVGIVLYLGIACCGGGIFALLRHARKRRSRA